ncbi:MAG: Xaa-Pro peptidase family protein [Candidatus Melainabacteria bacterium]|nr:MAG: Xaa-Pro peptidase family protein [Candidatus Melainabacteria bacterium]
MPLSFVPKYISGLSAFQKINKLKKSLKSNEDALFISNLADIAYFTNLRNYSQNYSSSFFARLLVFKNKPAILFTDFKLPNKNDFNQALNVAKQDEYINFLNNCDNIKNILLNKNSINLFDYNFLNIKFHIKPDNFSSNLKAIKTKEEINHLKSAFSRTDKVMQKVQKLVNGEENITEAQLFEFVEKEFKNEQSATNLSFSPIVGFGSNSSIIHYSVADEKCTLKDGDFVLLDTGGYFEGGYATDITRTFCRNLPNEKQKEIYTFVLKAFLNAFFAKNVKNGYKLDKIARNILNEKKSEGFLFNHALGHGVGVNVHEMPPSISKSKFSKRKLKPNMVFTIEPGAYKEKCFGVRLENTVYTVKKGNKLKIRTLVKFPFEEKCIDFGLLSKNEKRLFRKYKRLTK